MTKANITQYDSTPSNNADINDINIAENCPASNINNAIRELMAHLKNVDTGSQALTALSVAGSVTATTSLKTPLIEFTDGDNALTIADGGNVTANADFTVSGALKVSDGGSIGSASDTDAMAISSGGVVTFSQTPVGTFISEADMFRLTATQSGGTNADITANLERVDDASFSKIGTGMTNSSGVFSFPSTGLYYVIYIAMIRSTIDANSMFTAHVSTDSGGSYDDVGIANGGEGSASESSTSVSNHFFVNVTNTSTFRVKFATTSMASGSFLQGDTNQNYTTFTFIKLGESQ
jgi:hypothetical protein